jgi:tetratricopeptide (TPR) repeat protein
MRLRILLGFLVLALGLGSLTLWKRAQDRASLQREARFSNPFNDSLVAFQQKRYIDAEAILTGLLRETERESQGSAHAASVLHGLGAVTFLQHRNVEAEGYYRRAVSIRKKLLKPDDSELVSSLSGLAQTLREEGHEGEADQFYRETLVIYQRHPEIYRSEYAMCLLNVGAFALKQDQRAEGENLLVGAVTNFEKYEGDGSPHVALAATSLAELYEDESKYSESETLYRKALIIQEVQLSPDDPELGRTLDGLAAVLFVQGHSTEASSFKMRSRAIYEKAVPSQTVSEAVILNLRGQARAADGKYREAEALYKQAVKADEAKYGPDHPKVADDLNFLGKLYRDEQSFPIGRAEPIFQKILSTRQRNFGQNSPEAAQTLSDMALLYFYEKNYVGGGSFASRALPIQEKAFGPDSLEVSTTLNRLGLCQRDQGKLFQAETSIARSLAIRKRYLQPGHPWIAVSLENLASVYRAQGQSERASLLLESSRLIHLKDRHDQIESPPFR